jgi:hypothetical protein
MHSPRTYNFHASDIDTDTTLHYITDEYTYINRTFVSYIDNNIYKQP